MTQGKNMKSHAYPTITPLRGSNRQLQELACLFELAPPADEIELNLAGHVLGAIVRKTRKSSHPDPLLLLHKVLLRAVVLAVSHKLCDRPDEIALAE